MKRKLVRVDSKGRSLAAIEGLKKLTEMRQSRRVDFQELRRGEEA